MLLRVSTLLSLALATLLLTSTVHADETARGPDLFSAGYNGLLTGGLAGLGAGYLITREHGIHGEDWRTIGFSSGVGAISGAALGLTLGLVDLGSEGPARGGIVMRDALYGTGFGLLLGAAIGGATAIKTDEGEDVLFGAAIGTLTGAGLGLVIGFVDAEMRRSRARRTPPRYGATLGATHDVQGHMVWAPSLGGRF